MPEINADRLLGDLRDTPRVRLPRHRRHSPRSLSRRHGVPSLADGAHDRSRARPGDGRTRYGCQRDEPGLNHLVPNELMVRANTISEPATAPGDAERHGDAPEDAPAPRPEDAGRPHHERVDVRQRVVDPRAPRTGKKVWARPAMTEPSENFMSSRYSMIPREMSSQLMRPVGATTIIPAEAEHHHAHQQRRDDDERQDRALGRPAAGQVDGHRVGGDRGQRLRPGRG